MDNHDKRCRAYGNFQPPYEECTCGYEEEEEKRRAARHRARVRRQAAFEEIDEELLRAIKKFPLWPTDPVHALTVVGEEFGELTKAIVEHAYEPEKSSLDDVRKEAIQLAAMAIRFVMNFDYYEYVRSPQHDLGKKTDQ